MTSLLIMSLLLPLLLAGSAFFSASETALFSLTPHQRLRLARSGTLVGSMLTKLLVETRGMLITLLLGNMVVNVLFFVISSVLVIKLTEQDGAGALLITVASIVPLLCMITFGEVLPKLLAARLALPWARTAALPLFIFHRVIAPVRITASLLVVTPLARLIAPPTKPPALSAEELESLLELSEKHGVLDPGEERLLQQVLELNQLKVRDLMVPRVDIEAYDLDDPPAKLLDLIRATDLRHVPVYRDNLDNILGMIYARQALLRPPGTLEELQKLVRQVKFVPELQRADQLLVELRKTGTTFAIVVDEYGGTAGLVTIEDVVEHMVGDIPGAFELTGEAHVESLGQGRWRVGAALSVHDWADVFGRNAAVDGVAELQAVSTVGGLVMARLGRLPVEGDCANVGNVRFTVERMEDNRIASVLIALREANDAAATASSPSTSPAPDAPAKETP